MKKCSGILVLTLILGACQKPAADEQRRAEIEREVQQRLATEHQQQEQQQLAQREADVAARERAAAESERQTPLPTVTSARSQAPEIAASNETQPNPSYDLFYTKLEPYGEWLETENYGYVYRPREASRGDWRPYTNGQWAYTDAGWTWISDEPFGWAAYHYGRWTRLRNVGWVWVPGNEWAPAWVSWRKGGEFVGWAPLPPEAQFDRRSGIRNWSDNYYDIGPDQYVFVPTPQLAEQRVERAIVPEQRNITIVNQTTNVTNITFQNTTVINQGPDFDEIRRVSRQPIQQLRLERNTSATAADPRAVVRGQVVAVTAPVIAASAAAVQHAPAVKQKIPRTSVELGWGATNNQPGAEQARAKMKAEAAPPPNAPPKNLPRPVASAPAASPNSAVLPNARVPSAAPVVPASTPVIAPSVRARTPSLSPPQQAPVASPPASQAPRMTTPASTVRENPPANISRPAATPQVSSSPVGGARAAAPTNEISPVAPAAVTPSLSEQDRRREEQRAGQQTRQQMQAVDARQHREDVQRMRNHAAQLAASPSPMAAASATASLPRANAGKSPLPANSPESLRPRPQPTPPVTPSRNPTGSLTPAAREQRPHVRSRGEFTPPAGASPSASPSP